MDKSVIISGGDGFIGRHISEYLLQKGYSVYAIVIPESKDKEKLTEIKDINIIESYLSDYNYLSKQLPRKSEAFMHFAWKGVAPEYRKSIDIQKENINIALNAVKLASLTESKKFIFPGSTFEYIYSGQIINRYTLPSPSDAYGASKIAAKYYCEIMCKQLGIPFIYTVISGIYSADRIDNNVINYSITKLLRGEKPALTKLEQLWDYVHINDVLNAFEKIIINGKANGFYVIGHGDNCPLAEYIYKIRDIINPDLPLGVGELAYDGDKLPMSCVDLSELSKDTGFLPKIEFDTGIRDVINKIKEREGTI